MRPVGNNATSADPVYRPTFFESCTGPRSLTAELPTKRSAVLHEDIHPGDLGGRQTCASAVSETEMVVMQCDEGAGSGAVDLRRGIARATRWRPGSVHALPRRVAPLRQAPSSPPVRARRPQANVGALGRAPVVGLGTLGQPPRAGRARLRKDVQRAPNPSTQTRLRRRPQKAISCGSMAQTQGIQNPPPLTGFRVRVPASAPPQVPGFRGTTQRPWGNGTPKGAQLLAAVRKRVLRTAARNPRYVKRRIMESRPPRSPSCPSHPGQTIELLNIIPESLLH